MASNTQHCIARSLRAMLVDLPNGGAIDESEEFRDLLAGLERFLPEVLREKHPEWIGESLDGILPFVSRKTADGEIEIVGMCILISDQTLAPLHLRLQVNDKDEVSWLECRLGEVGELGMQRIPYPGIKATARLRACAERPEMIEWSCQVAFGNRRV